MNRVTPFSKFLALVLALIVICAGYIVGSSYGHDATPSMIQGQTSE